MKTTYKYHLTPDVVNEIGVPEGARILCAHAQYGNPTIWALVDPAAPLKRRRIAVYTTGGKMEDPEGAYVGTVMLYDETLVLHVFDLGEVPGGPG